MTLSAQIIAPSHIVAETPADAAAVEAVVTTAFGPGRFAKTAERLREQARIVVGFVDREDGHVVGSVRLWAITVGDTPALFLGPIAVAGEHRRAGRGAELVAACIDYARQAGVAGVLLVGDLPYFSRFGFEAAPDVRLFGPVDPRRLLWAPLSQVSVSGAVRPVR